MSFLLVGTLFASCASSSASGDRPMPAFDGHNGIVVEGIAMDWAKNDSLRDWTGNPDFVIAGRITDQTLYDPPPPAGQDPNDPAKSWNSLRTVTVDRVLWERSDGTKPPATFEFLDQGWATDDEGVVHAMIPSEGVRLDVGDTFVAAFYDTSRGAATTTRQAARAEEPPSPWAVLGSTGAMIVRDGRIVTDERTPAYQRDLAGLTIDEFAAKVNAAAER